MIDASRVWWPRRIARGVFEIVQPDGRKYGEITVPEWEWSPSSVAYLVVRAIAESYGESADLVARDPEVDAIDWRKLGWSSEAEHDGLLLELRRVRDESARRWPAVVGYVTASMASADLPKHGPFSVEQLDELDRIVSRAIAVAAQDADAEGVAA